MNEPLSIVGTRRSLRLRRVLLIVAIVPPLLAAVYYLHYTRHNYLCQGCWSSRHVYHWRVGDFPGDPLIAFPEWERVESSHLNRDFFAESHAHNWQFRQGSPYFFLGTTWGGCMLGSARRTCLAKTYEFDVEFRQRVREMIEDGSVARDDVVDAFSLPRLPANPRRLSPGSDAAYATARKLLEAHYGSDLVDWFCDD